MTPATWLPDPSHYPEQLTPLSATQLKFQDLYKGSSVDQLDALVDFLVNYDRYRTDGLTPEDVIEAISATYGEAATTAGEILFPSAYSENVKVIARWEDARYSFNLVRSPYQPSFALIVFSKELDALAQAAVLEATRLEALDAPQREVELQRKQGEVSRVRQEKARLVNKPGFRP